MPTVLESLNAGLQRAFTANPQVFLLGEDILDPYGGAFKVTRGLSAAFPNRVLTTPVSEAAITGFAAGMALRGFRPIVEIMFGDFTTLLADQLINHIAKLRWMYNDQVDVPLVIRAPMGGRRGYGPTHSQTLEKIYLGIPGLRVLAPTTFGNPGRLLEQAILVDAAPVLFIENKLLYTQPLVNSTAHPDLSIQEAAGHHAAANGQHPFPAMLPSAGYAPAYRVQIAGAPPPNLTILSYGYAGELARQAMLRLAYEQEIFAELIVLTQLSPFDAPLVLDSFQRTGRLIIFEEGTQSLSWSAEWAARAAEARPSQGQAVIRLAAKDLPVPASAPLEAAVLPQIDDLMRIARRITQAA